MVRNVLSQMEGVATEQQFLATMFKGLSTNYDTPERNIIYKFLYKKPASNPQCPLGFYIDAEDNYNTFED